MIKDKPNKPAIWFFINVVERYILRHFKKVSFIEDLKLDEGKACLVLMNHYSFNDGAIMFRLSRQILGRNFRVMVVESQLKAFIALKYVGCFSINKKSRTVIESLNYAAELLKDPKNMLGIYPQGEVYSIHLNRVHFESGLSQILKKSKDVPFQIILGVTLLDYLDSFKPHARVYLTEYEGVHALNEIEDAYNQFYQQCKINQQELHHPPEHVIDRKSY